MSDRPTPIRDAAVAAGTNYRITRNTVDEVELNPVVAIWVALEAAMNECLDLGDRVAALERRLDDLSLNRACTDEHA